MMVVVMSMTHNEQIKVLRGQNKKGDGVYSHYHYN